MSGSTSGERKGLCICVCMLVCLFTRRDRCRKGLPCYRKLLRIIEYSKKKRVFFFLKRGGGAFSLSCCSCGRVAPITPSRSLVQLSTQRRHRPTYVFCVCVWHHSRQRVWTATWLRQGVRLICISRCVACELDLPLFPLFLFTLFLFSRVCVFPAAYTEILRYFFSKHSRTAAH